MDCQHLWEPTDNHGHSMECTVCGEKWSINSRPEKMSSIKVPHVKTKSQQSLFQSILRYAKNAGFKLSSGTARDKIGHIADHFQVNFEELTDPSKIEERHNGPTYVLFGVRHVVSPPTIHPWIVVVDEAGTINEERRKY